MPTLPGAVLPWVELRFLDANGDPLDSGTLEFFIAGTTTPKNTYSTSDISPSTGTPNPNPITLGADGRPADPIFLASGGYKVVVKNSAGVQQYSFDDVEDVGLTFLSELAVTFATGSLSVTSPYTVIATDNLVVMTSAGGDDPATVALPAASDRTFPLVVKNKTSVTLQINVDGSDTIEGALSSFTLPADASPSFPSVVLVSDGVSNWWIWASHEAS